MSRENQRANFQRRLQETTRLLAEREMQLKFLAQELQRREYIAYSSMECIGALFTCGGSITQRFEAMGSTAGDPVLDSYLLQLREVMKRYQKTAEEPPPGAAGAPEESAPTIAPVEPGEGGGVEEPAGASSEDPGDAPPE